MNPQLLPAASREDAAPWEQTLYAFLGEKERRSGSRRTVESYARLLWPFFARAGSPETIAPAHVLAWAYGVGASGREPSSATVGARIAALSSFYRFLTRMNVATGNPCDAVERPRTVQSVARAAAWEHVRALARHPRGPARPAGDGHGGLADRQGLQTRLPSLPSRPVRPRWWDQIEPDVAGSRGPVSRAREWSGE